MTDEEIEFSYEDSKNIQPIWRLAEDYSVFDAAALIAGYEPTKVKAYINDTFFERQFPQFSATLKVLCTAITNGKVSAQVRYSAREYGYADAMTDIDHSEANYVHSKGISAEEGEILSSDESFFFKPFPDWELTTVSRDALIFWMDRRGYISDFFFPKSKENTGIPDYLNPDHPRYAVKLAAAIQAWEAVTEEPGKHPKQALTRWLNQHASKFGLTDNDGLPVKLSIEDCAKVANWRPGGGAPTTPGE
ncbi:hypothetical protein [Chromobacterium violaceum]|uniref:hypothetical protein n=1 Tax=Chromobacterium violaceum TaxID=536 RepID=UPI0019525539|nr:hypothetical protein [Chromobacterium violaceum]QRO32603.1 hypothetical protein I6K04_19350 [Chromobacterium violaceum]QRQ17596.1 hypothetical protein I6K03_03375 [Chromobacterium violaceum]